MFSFKKSAIFCLLSATVFFLNSCTSKNTLFQLVSSDHSGIHFNNQITENDSINPIDMINIYNGGGVGIGDFNGDGRTDLILFGGLSNSGAGYQVLLNDGTGNFTAAGSGSLTSEPEPAVVGDFNHDGKLDFAVAQNGPPPFSVFFGNGDGTFSAPSAMGTSSNGDPVLATAVDLNGDGYTDIVYMDSYVA